MPKSHIPQRCRWLLAAMLCVACGSPPAGEPVDAAPGITQASTEGWTRFVEQARERYPLSGERRLLVWEPAYTPPGAPSGEYARLVFESAPPSLNRGSVVLLRSDVGWRVAMYGILGS